MPNEAEEKILEEVKEEAQEESKDLELAPVVVEKIPEKAPKERRKNERRQSRRTERVRQEFDNKIISVRRVTRVVAGGRRFSFSIAVVLGDKKGRVGVGIGKAGDTPIAVDKAIRAAKKNLIKAALTVNNSIAHPVKAKFSSAVVSLMPAPGRGMTAGSAARIVLELAGVKEVSSKILSRSKNKLNIARATIKALSQINTTRITNKESNDTN